MIYGVGTDVVELARMRRLWERWGERAVRHILTGREAGRLRRARDPARFLALYFSGKEAVVKALGTGFCPRMTLHDVEIVPDALGRPEVEFSAAGAVFVAERGAGAAHLSLTDDAGIAFAVCVMLRAF
jgi:holo-[acyl-carrier protein] synthase